MKADERKLDEIDIKKAAILYLDGNSLRSVAKIYNVSHVTLLTYFNTVLSSISPLLASEVRAALDDNAPMSIKKPEVVDRILKSYHMFVNNRLSITEISNSLGVSFFTTYRDLERRLYLLYEAFPEFVTKEMVDRVKLLMKTHRLNNLINNNVENTDNKYTK